MRLTRASPYGKVVLMRNIRCCLLFLLLVVIWSASAAIACAQATPDVEAQLSLAGGKSVYRTGDPIRLVLTFTANVDGYLLNNTATKPASPVDEILVSPDSKVIHWLDQYSGGSRYSPDYASIQELNSTPALVVLSLNDVFRFDQPGRYTVRVKTARVARGKGPNPSAWGTPVTLATNEVSFEVKAMSDAEEEQEVLRLSTQLDAARDWRSEERISEELSYLAGDISTREKVRRFINAEGRSGNYFGNISLGLYMARNRALVVKLLESAMRDPSVEVSLQLIGTLTHLRMLQEKTALKPASPDKKQAQQDEERHSSEIKQAYVRELAASLTKRAGKSRTTGAMTVLALLPKDKAEAARMLASVREILIQEFEQLHPFSQEYLLRVYWEQLRDPVLIPAVERIVTQNNSPQGQMLRTTAIKRLMELSRERARPFIIAEIRNPQSLAELDVLALLDEPVLPEVDSSLLEQIKALAPLKQHSDSVYLRHKSQLVARYASAAIYDELMETYKTWGSKWSPDARAGLLAYFSRYEEKQSLVLIEQALAGLQSGQDFFFLGELARAYYSNGLDALLQKRLAGDEPEAVSSAAYFMSQHGPAANKQLIEARLNRWLNEWKGRTAELESDDKYIHQRMVQVNLIEALTRAKSWKLPDEQAMQLKQACITQICRQHFQLR